MSESYDPYIPHGGSSANPSASGGNSGPNPETAAIHVQIDDTVGITRDNITGVVERYPIDNPAVSTQGFRRNDANRVRKNMWCKDMKMCLIIGLATTAIIVIIVISIVTLGHHHK